MKLKHTAVLGMAVFAALLYGCGSASYEEGPNPSADTVAPAVSSVAPAIDETAVAIDTTVTVTFSKAMDRASVEGSFTLAAAAAVGGTFSWTDDTIVIFTPSAPLAYLTTYTIALDTTAKDQNGNHLAAGCASVFTTRAENFALLLDGIEDGAKFSDSIFPKGSNSSFTVEAWIYPTASREMIILSDNAYDLSVTSDSGNLIARFKVWDDACGSSYVNLTESGISLNQWNHVAGTYNKDINGFGMAVNGSLFMTGSPSSIEFCDDLSYKFGIGNYNSLIGPIGLGFEGKIDEVRISNVARYATDFIPAESFVLDTNTVALWHVDDPIGSTSFSDSSGNGYTLTAVGDAKTGR